jgi:hypothetical protein
MRLIARPLAGCDTTWHPGAGLWVQESRLTADVLPDSTRNRPSTMVNLIPPRQRRSGPVGCSRANIGSDTPFLQAPRLLAAQTPRRPAKRISASPSSPTSAMP